jgi:hypothetical protein
MSTTPPVEGSSARGADHGVHGPRISHYEHAAREAVIAHPLPGEDVETPYLEDAQMWLGVYRELLGFKRTLIDDMDAALATMPEPACQEVASTDAVILHAEADRFRQRLDFWQRRCDELRSTD